MRQLPWTLLVLAATAVARADDAAEALFVRRVAPLLAEKCVVCHGKDERKIKGGLDLRTAEAAMVGGDSGKPGIIPGKPEESAVYLAVLRLGDVWEPMPPKEADKLTSQQIGWIKQWIASGAPWPNEERSKQLARANAQVWSAEDGIEVKTSGGLSPEWTHRKYRPEGLWAYQPVLKPAVKVTDFKAIDALISARMPQGLDPAPVADARAFIRRATFDLTGLPPAPEAVEAFETAFAREPNAAVRELVNRLLASPHYGERMAQHWLDVTRYADSSGFANDFERGNAWRYRDYVVRAFNADKPYDQFVREQIAGDEIAPGDPELLVATGFLRMGPWELTAMEVPRIARQRFLDDVTNSVGETFLAHSLQCARCHDHKFDPVPTRDYYRIQAVFATTQLAERAADFLPVENTAGFEEKKYLEQRRADYSATLARLDEKSLRNAETWHAERKLDPAKWLETVKRMEGKGQRKRGSLFNTARNALLKEGVPEDQFPPRMLGWTAEEIGSERVANKGIERLAWELERYQPFALSVYTGGTPQVKTATRPSRMPANPVREGELEQTCILTGGDPFASGEKVKPGALSVLGDVERKPIPDSPEGRRKAFAEWVASPRNSLTTRAIVNRVWLWHFGQPLAGNPNNFGSTGKKPTHPELLDHLAAALVEEGWSIKALHRLIMNSDTYRRSTAHPNRKLLMEKDPTSTSYAVFQPRRLTAEELRDAMLSASGELNPTLGGIPIRPEINMEAALQPRQVMGTFAAAWTPNSRPEQRHRRSLYALKLRGLSDPAMEVFNSPAPDFSCERREVSTVTPQVFSLFNSEASHLRALAFAARAIKESATEEQAIVRCFQLAYGRLPRPDEIETCGAHWREMERSHARMKVTARNPPLEVRRDAVEENTGEKFSFTERLHANADFVPDLQPADVDGRTRALADVCLALFNSNEFVYVY